MIQFDVRKFFKRAWWQNHRTRLRSEAFFRNEVDFSGGFSMIWEVTSDLMSLFFKMAGLDMSR